MLPRCRLDASQSRRPRAAGRRAYPRCPAAHGADGMMPSATVRNSAPSGQLASKWMRMRAACSMTRAPILIRRSRMVANSAFASGAARNGVAHGEHQPVRNGVERKPRVSGTSAACAPHPNARAAVETMGHGLSPRSRGCHDRCTSDSRRLAAPRKSPGAPSMRYHLLA
jgi:hypothetical protein